MAEQFHTFYNSLVITAHACLFTQNRRTTVNMNIAGINF